MVNITLNTKTRSCIASSTFLGYEGENSANKLIFTFDDEFVDGSAQLNIKRENENGYVALIRVKETYELEVKSSLVSRIGDVTFQLQVSKADGTIYKYDAFVMTVKDAIDSDVPLPEEYPTWQDAIATALAEIDNIDVSVDKIDHTTTLTVIDKKGVITEVEIHDGKDGVDGVSPTVMTEQTDTGTKITVTDVNGTQTAEVLNGKDGTDGISSEISVKTDTETEYVLTVKDKNGSFDTPNLKGKDAEEGIVNETDPLYSADKPNIALKTEIPTKVSELNNDKGYITGYTETDPTVPSHVKAIKETDITNWNNKQDVLTAGNNITIENGVISASSTGGGIAELPIASADILGGIKVGEGLEITEDGILSALGGATGGSGTSGDYGMFYYKQAGTNSSRTELFPTETEPEGYLGTGLTNMEQDEQGRPILKKGKIYKFTVITGEIYFSSTSGYYYATVALNENYRVLTTTIIPTTYGTVNNNNNPALKRETGLAKIEEDTALKVYDGWGGASSGIRSADFYVLVEEVSASGGSSSSGTKKVTLWEGEFGTEGNSVTLSDSVENYDSILVEACVNYGGNVKGNIETRLLDVKTIIEFNNNSYNLYASGGTSHYYRILFEFTNVTTLKLTKATVESTTWTNPHITKVIGIKY